ncbi:hypothetical protein B0H13DRAFT_2101078 [Mycena leptocephala]|nr:hypothetical protein B0H13DRAFT_2101078 [Mycena leptocephala]
MSGQSMARRRCANEEWDGTLIIRFGFVCASSSVSPRPHTVSDLVSCLLYSLSLFLFWFAVHHSLFWFPLHLTIGFRPLVVIVYISYCRLLAARGTPY